jgi:phage/plasmid-like protein (TIGR03299 family)
MAAYFECGFSVRKPMWHGEGTVLEDYPESWDEARRFAGLLWEPTQVPVFTKAGDEFTEAEAFRAIARDDTGAVLAVPSDRYQVITHADMGEIIDAVLEADGNVRFETAGSVREGRQVWALAYLDEPYEVPGDSTQTFPFLALLNAHDGSAACKLTYTDVRVVCWNTWNAASEQGERTGAQFTFRHTGDVGERIEQAKQALGELREESKATRRLFEALAQVPVSDEQVRMFTQLFLASPADHGEFVSEKVANNVARARGTFDRLYHESKTTESIRGNAYGLLQSATEYLDHVRRFRNSDSLMGRTLLRPEPFKARALDLIEDVVGADWNIRGLRDEQATARRRAKLARVS